MSSESYWNIDNDNEIIYPWRMVDENLLTLTDVADRLGISKVTLWRWIKNGKLSAVRLSKRTVYVRKDEVERFIRESEK